MKTPMVMETATALHLIPRADFYTIAYGKEGFDKFGYLRRYSANTFNLESSVEIKGGPKPYHVAVQPNGDLVAVSLLSQAGVYLYRSSKGGLKSLDEDKQPITENVSRGLGKISWSSDGKSLIGGGSYNNGRHFMFRVWNKEGQGVPKDFEGPTWYISHLIPCGDSIAFSARDPAFGLIDVKQKKIIWMQTRSGANMVKKQFGHLKVSKDGHRVSFGLGYKSESPIIFDVNHRRLDPGSNNVPGLYPANYHSLNITGWNERETIPQRPTDPLLNGRRIAPMLPEGDVQGTRHRVTNKEEWVSLGIAPRAGKFVLGSEWRLRGYKKNSGDMLSWVKKVPGRVWAVNITRNEKLVVAAYDDGTIRWHNLENGKELLALFVHAKERRWIAWTPQGYFDASIGGEDLIGWHINNGPKAAADFFYAYEYRDRLARKDIVRLVLTELDEDKAIRLADSKRKETEREEKIIKPKPVVSIHSPGPSHKFEDSNSHIPINFSIRLPSDFEDAIVDVLVDGVSYKTFSNQSRIDLENTGLTAWVRLPKRDCVVSIVATASRIGEQRIGSKSIDFIYQGPPPDKVELPRLFGLVIGVAENYEKDDKLTVADKDATDFKAALETQMDKVFRDISINL